MRDSDTYLAILEEGEAIRARKHILFLGGERFASPSEAVSATLASFTDLDRLERVLHRCLEASTWQDLLDTP